MIDVLILFTVRTLRNFAVTISTFSIYFNFLIFRLILEFPGSRKPGSLETTGHYTHRLIMIVPSISFGQLIDQFPYFDSIGYFLDF
jgi:hypothetical protein